MKIRISTYAGVLILLIFFAGCGKSPTVAPTVTPIPTLTSTPTATRTPAPTITPTTCPYMQNPGPTPPEVEKRAQEAFINLGATGIRGKLQLDAYGEYSCEHFGVMGINYVYTVTVTDLGDQAAMRAIVATLKESAKNTVQGYNLGQVTVRFVTGQQCVWDELQNACSPIEPLEYR